MIKRGYSTQMSYDITNDEKVQAEKALMAFEYALKVLNLADQHLNIMFIPFKDHGDIKPEEILKFRAALRRFRDKAIENFNNFKIAAFKCINLIQTFSSDTQTAKLIKSFISSVEDMENQVNNFSKLFESLESKDFVQKVVQIIDGIKKEIKQLNQIVEDRIRTHIQTNILGKTWVDSISKDLQVNVEKKTPLLIELNKERQKELSELFKNKEGK
jgi:hypothetical protein